MSSGPEHADALGQDQRSEGQTEQCRLTGERQLAAVGCLGGAGTMSARACQGEVGSGWDVELWMGGWPSSASSAGRAL